MLRFTVRRVLQLVVVIAVLALLLFAWLRSLPGGPVSALCGDRCSEAAKAQLQASLGLDRSLPVQLGSFIGRVVSGDFGTSTGVQPGVSAAQIFLDRFPATVELAFVAIVLAIVLGVPLGYVSARRRGTWLDNAGVVGSLIGVAVPVFFLAFLLKYVFAVRLGWLPSAGRQSVDINATKVTGFATIDGLFTGEYDATWDALTHLVLPAVTLATIPFAVVFRITRAAVLGVLDEDYVRTAEAKGLLARTIRSRHVLRNALLPVVTTIGLQVGALLAGAVLTETVFAYRGLGDALATAFRERDYSVLQVLILAAAVVYVVVNLLVDLSYALIDPRVRTR